MPRYNIPEPKNEEKKPSIFPKERLLFVLMLILIMLSFLILFSSGAKMAYDITSDGSIFDELKYQMKNIVMAALCFVVAYAVRPEWYRRLAPWIFLAALVLTSLTFMGLGKSVNGAARWIEVLGFRFQPSEALKVATMIVLAWSLDRVATNFNKNKALRKSVREKNAESAYYGGDKVALPPKVQGLTDLRLTPNLIRGVFFDNKKGRTELFDGVSEGFTYVVLPILLACGIVVFAHTSSAFIICGASLIVLYYGRINIWELISFCAWLGVAFVGYVATGAGRALTILGRIGNWFSGDVQAAEEEVLLSNLDDTYRAMIAIHKGGPLGLGPGKSLMRAEMVHPESDYVFAFFIEEWGMLMGVALVLIYIAIFFRSFKIFNETKSSHFNSFLVLGLGSLITMQAFFHIFVSLNIFPETGLILPFVSRGGTALFCCTAAIGIMMRVARTNDAAELLRERERLRKRSEAAAARFEAAQTVEW
ncbi:MAG: FtsW/RodA/SpoVE family cell cycle protein [Rikenellaceae bacterium]